MADARQTTAQTKRIVRPKRFGKLQRNHSERLYSLAGSLAEHLYRLAVGRSARHSRRALRVGIWVHPAAMHTTVERVSRLRIDIPLPHEAAESSLDVTGWAAEPVVEVKMAESSIEIIAPE